MKHSLLNKSFLIKLNFEFELKVDVMGKLLTTMLPRQPLNNVLSNATKMVNQNCLMKETLFRVFLIVCLSIFRQNQFDLDFI